MPLALWKMRGRKNLLLCLLSCSSVRGFIGVFFIMSSGKGACLSPVEGYFLVHAHHSNHKDTEFVFVCASSLYAFLLPIKFCESAYYS